MGLSDEEDSSVLATTAPTESDSSDSEVAKVATKTNKSKSKLKTRYLSLPQRTEEACHVKGFECIVGVDEAGRGPLAGPVVAAACYIPLGLGPTFPGVQDSKKMTELDRELAFEELTSSKEVIYAIEERDAIFIDRSNILAATLDAMAAATYGVVYLYLEKQLAATKRREDGIEPSCCKIAKDVTSCVNGKDDKNGLNSDSEDYNDCDEADVGEKGKGSTGAVSLKRCDDKDNVKRNSGSEYIEESSNCGVKRCFEKGVGEEENLKASCGDIDVNQRVTYWRNRVKDYLKGSNSKVCSDVLKGFQAKVLIDGNKAPPPLMDDDSIDVTTIVKGDASVFCIAAASILAKVTRDRLMIRMDEEYPQFGFKQHKGYPTSLHQSLISEHGPSYVHRLTFQPTKGGILSGDMTCPVGRSPPRPPQPKAKAKGKVKGQKTLLECFLKSCKAKDKEKEKSDDEKRCCGQENQIPRQMAKRQRRRTEVEG